MTVPNRPPLSIVVPTRDRPAHLHQCLAALAADLRPGDQVSVVDSASVRPPDTARVLAAFPAEIDVAVLRAPRRGTSLARNLGWRTAAHDVIAFVDDDVTVRPGWADAVRAGLAEPGVQFATGWIGVPAHQADVAEPNPLMVVEQSFRIDRDRRGLLGAGANLAARRTALETVGGFDERLGPGNRIPAGEDHDLLDRLLAAGCTGRYLPDARVEHDQWRNRRQGLAQHWRIGLGSGARLRRLAATDRSRLPMVVQELLVDDIARAVVGSLRAGYRTGTLLAVLRLVGLLTGVLTAPRPARFRPPPAAPRPPARHR